MSLVLVACVRLLCNSSCSSRHLSCQLTLLGSTTRLGPESSPSSGGTAEVTSLGRRGRSRGDDGVECEDLT
ncbi:hypothetical protein BDFB_008318 [Asbolus verrucosus]|uniref:Secreted protein n=1 Tax=Asbolus verrucosus TaxID=1661398 RepID=A0A482VAL2_ASBVE|nr:hypothetical protein BDFB_008318 [Asbolus verrucosus]